MRGMRGSSPLVRQGNLALDGYPGVATCPSPGQRFVTLLELQGLLAD